MIKSIKPGLLATLSDSVIERKLGELFQCDVDYSQGVAKIYCIDQYDDESEDPPYKHLIKHMQKLKKVGRACIACNRSGPYVLLEFNSIAMDVISGERARREAKRVSNKQGERQ